MLEDVQDRPDDRQLPIGEVGISGIRYPVAVWDREHGKQDTVAEVSMSVDLRAGRQGRAPEPVRRGPARLRRESSARRPCRSSSGKLRQRLGSRRARVPR